jgi:hypothetical protein
VGARERVTGPCKCGPLWWATLRASVRITEGAIAVSPIFSGHIDRRGVMNDARKDGRRLIALAANPTAAEQDPLCAEQVERGECALRSRPLQVKDGRGLRTGSSSDRPESP